MEGGNTGLEDWGLGKVAKNRARAFLMPPPQAFDLSNKDENETINWDCQINFPDEFRIMITHCNDAPGLFVFNTLIPQDHPGNFRHFVLSTMESPCPICLRTPGP